MNRSMSGAVMLSMTLHCALFLTLLSIKHEPSTEGSPPILNVRLQPIDDGDVSDDATGDETAGDAPSDSTANAEEAAPHDQETRTVALHDVAPAVEPAALDAGRPPSRSASRSTTEKLSENAPGQIDGPSVDAQPPVETFDAITLTEQSDRAVPLNRSDPLRSVSEKIPMTEGQRRMLNEQFEEWTESLGVRQSESSLEWEYEGQPYTAVFRPIPTESDMELEGVIVEVSTQQNGNKMSSEMRMKRLAFSSFAQFVDRWDPAVQLHDDEVDGRFHSNSEIHLAYSRSVKPIFHGTVTTASRKINTDNATGRVRREEMFLGGLETGVGKIGLPKDFLPFLDAVGKDQVQYFEEDTRITFYPDGTYGWSHAKSSAPERRSTISDSGSYLVAARKAQLHLKGVVKGRVLAYSPDRIIIEDDLIYAHDPSVDPDGEDYLGLVSDRYVEIAHRGITGPGDLLVHAAIYAKRRFVVTNYRARENATLFIYGSLAAGSLSVTEPRFSTRIQFDERLETMRPPSFPMSDRYEMEAWDGHWEIDSLASREP